MRPADPSAAGRSPPPERLTLLFSTPQLGFVLFPIKRLAHIRCVHFVPCFPFRLPDANTLPLLRPRRASSATAPTHGGPPGRRHSSLSSSYWLSSTSFSGTSLPAPLHTVPPRRPPNARIIAFYNPVSRLRVCPVFIACLTKANATHSVTSCTHTVDSSS